MDTVAQWTEWFSALSLRTHTHTHTHTHWENKQPEWKTAAGKPWAGRGRGRRGLICPDVFDLSFLLNVTDLVQFHMPTLRHRQTRQEQLTIERSNGNQSCSGTCRTVRSIFSSHSRQEKKKTKTKKNKLDNSHRISQPDSGGCCRF